MTQSIHALLRNTTLHLALLSQGGSMPAAYEWRARCAALVERLRQDLRDADYDDDLIDEVCRTQCALLDEGTLRHLPSGQREAWLQESLLARFFGTSTDDGATFARIRVVLSTSLPRTELVDLYRTVLGLGFASSNDPGGRERSRLIAGLDARVPRVATLAASRMQSHVTRQNPLPRRNAAAYAAAGAVVIAALVWCVADAYLERVSRSVADPVVVPSLLHVGMLS